MPPWRNEYGLMIEAVAPRLRDWVACQREMVVGIWVLQDHAQKAYGATQYEAVRVIDYMVSRRMVKKFHDEGDYYISADTSGRD